MPALPTIRITKMGELFRDGIGQLWCPATIALTWAPTPDLPAPAISVDVIALARADMTLDELQAACLQAAHDVMSAALLSLERPQNVGLPEPSISATSHH